VAPWSANASFSGGGQATFAYPHQTTVAAAQVCQKNFEIAEIFHRVFLFFGVGGVTLSRVWRKKIENWARTRGRFAMNSTSISLLERLRQEPDEAAWERFVRLYTPLLLYWARRLGLQDEDAADLVQDVLVVLVRKLPEFQYQRERSFRGWMRTVLMNKWRDRRERGKAIPLDTSIEPEAAADDDGLDEREYRLYVIGRALRLMSSEFEPSTWQSCWETVVGGRPVAEVAAELGITVNAVYLAKSRVLARLRQDLKGLLD
jgi:RNA polymerase sigma-70 factor (ECF subfamily)